MNRSQRRRVERQLRSIERQLQEQPWPSGRVFSAEELLAVAVVLGEETFDKLIQAVEIGTPAVLRSAEAVVANALHTARFVSNTLGRM